MYNNIKLKEYDREAGEECEFWWFLSDTYKQKDIEKAKEIDRENYSQDNFCIFGYYDIEKNKFSAGIEYIDETWTVYDSFSSIDDIEESDILDILYEIREKEIRKAIV